MKPRILLIDDSESVRAAISSVLPSHEYLLTTTSNGTEGLSHLEQQKYDLVLLDYNLPDIDGLNLLYSILENNPDLPVIMVTGSGSERIAVDALKNGASDYVVKSGDFISKLPHVVQDTLEKHEMKRRNRELEGQLRESYKQLKQLNKELEIKIQTRTEELERAYQLSNELMTKAVESNMQLAELYSEVDEARRKLDEKIREMSLLHEVGKIMASTFEKDELLQVAIDSIYQELGVEHCAILLINDETSRIQIGASRGTPDDLFIAAKSLDGEEILRDIIHKNAPVLVQDIESHEQFHLLAQDFPGVECLMLAPLCVKDHEIGVFTFYGYEDTPTFRQSDLEFVSSLANQTSIALTNIILAEQRLQEEQMEMLNQMTGHLMHNLKDSLTMIRGYAEKINSNELDPGTTKDSARVILDQVDRIAGTTQELLEFFSGQQGIPKLRTVAVSDFIEAILPHIGRDFADHNISVHTNLQYTGQFKIDIEKMKQVFGNIANNALRAMPDGGTFTLTSQLVNDMIQFEFIDEGCGMSPELQVRMFDPFVSEWSHKGTGLGMTIVKKIIQEHRGQIDVQSIAAKGTTVRIVLPGIQQRTWEHRKIVEATQEK